jgi:two-component system response regulator AtoC
MARILVVDDEPGLREFVGDSLRLDGHDVVEAEDGRVALKRLDERGFDLVITDLRMPHVDGLTLLAKLKADQPEVEVIVMTAFGAVDSAVAAMKAGAFDYLQKPLGGPDELRLVVERALERRRLLDAKAGASADDGLPPLTYGDPAMAPVVSAIEKVARTSASVLLLGETGTGKEVAARAIHARSDRRARPFLAINGAALAENLLESELFGHERGAFTGAVERRRGKIELADGGSVLPRRDRRAQARAAGQAPARAAGAALRAARRHPQPRRRRAVDRGDQPRSRRDDDARPLPRGPLPSPRGVPDPPAAAARAQGRPGAAGPRAAGADRTQRAWPRADARRRRRGPAGGVALAGQRPRAGQHARARRDPRRARRHRRRRHLARGRRAAATSAARRSPPSGRVARPLVELERDAIVAALTSVAGNRRKAAELLGIAERTLYDKLKRYGIE